MTNSKMWRVLPSAGIVPMLLAAVAVGALALHVVSPAKTPWLSGLLAAQPPGAADATVIVPGDTDDQAVRHAGGAALVRD